MNKHIFTLALLPLISVFTGCSSVPAPESKYSYVDNQKQTSVLLSAPNLSNFHNPPAASSLAYIKVYEVKDVCEKRKTLFGEAYKQAKPIGEIYVSKADRSKYGQLPVGNIVIQSGFDVHGIGSRLTCDRYFQFQVKEGFEYEVEVKESRPLVTSCYVSIKEKNPKGGYSDHLTNFYQSKDGGFLGLEENMSPICESGN